MSGNAQLMQAAVSSSSNTRQVGCPLQHQHGCGTHPLQWSPCVQMMQQPAFQEAMQSMLARPDMVNAMMNANPQMRQMMDTNPGMRWGAVSCICCMLV